VHNCILDPAILDILNDCPVTLREGVEGRLATFVNGLAPDSDQSERMARTVEHARRLVNVAHVEDISQAWGISTSRLDRLHKQYDRVVWDAVWKTLKDDAGQIFQEHRDKRSVAEDLHNECWAKIADKIGEFKDGDGRSISGWLWKVSQNVVLDWKRKQARRSGIAPMVPYIDAGHGRLGLSVQSWNATSGLGNRELLRMASSRSSNHVLTSGRALACSAPTVNSSSSRSAAFRARFFLSRILNRALSWTELMCLGPSLFGLLSR